MSEDNGLAAPGSSAARPEEAETGTLLYPNLYVFVERYLAEVYARPHDHISPWRWCPRWWDHPEAVSRLDALWQAFEALRNEPGTGPATWWRDYADPTMTALTDSAGPFSQCSIRDRHVVHEPLTCTRSPAGIGGLATPPED